MALVTSTNETCLIDLPVETMREIMSLLNKKDAFNFARSCKAALRVMPRMHRMTLSNFSDSSRTDKYRHFTKAIELASPPMCIEAKCKWADQGWGNRKGRVLLFWEREGRVDESTATDLFGIAEHETKSVSRSIEHEHTFIQKWQPGDRLAIGFRVGGGGGHSLTLHSLTVEVLVSDAYWDQEGLEMVREQSLSDVDQLLRDQE